MFFLFGFLLQIIKLSLFTMPLSFVVAIRKFFVDVNLTPSLLSSVSNKEYSFVSRLVKFIDRSRKVT